METVSIGWNGHISLSTSRTQKLRVKRSDEADKATITEFAFGDSSIDWSYQDGSMLPIGAVASEYAARCTLRETANAIAVGNL